MRAVDYVSTGALVILALTVVDIAVQIRTVRRLLEALLRQERRIFHGSDPVLVPDPDRSRRFGPLDPRDRRAEGTTAGLGEAIDEVEMGFCVWSFRGGRWEVELNQCHAGYAPSPPARDGEYEGQCVRTVCRRQE